LQWVGFGRLLWANRKPIFATTLILGTYLIATDVVAVGFGVWHFDDALILGFSPGGVPIEEWLFFYLTVLIVVQSFILFLPRPLRYNPPVTSE
jgi:lycopene cyclase domain-containing protein